jgi:hypothetical protein
VESTLRFHAGQQVDGCSPASDGARTVRLDGEAAGLLDDHNSCFDLTAFGAFKGVEIAHLGFPLGAYQAHFRIAFGAMQQISDRLVGRIGHRLPFRRAYSSAGPTPTRGGRGPTGYSRAHARYSTAVAHCVPPWKLARPVRERAASQHCAGMSLCNTNTATSLLENSNDIAQIMDSSQRQTVVCS